jgi:hypothetical protein
MDVVSGARSWPRSNSTPTWLDKGLDGVRSIRSIARVGARRASAWNGRTASPVSTPIKRTPNALLELDRGYWSIENSLHHVRDVTMGEDACRVPSEHADRFLAATRNAVLRLWRKVKAKSIAAVFRRFMVHPLEALELLNRSE